MFDRLKKSVRQLFSLATSGVRSPADWFVDWVNGQKKGKIKVTQDTALNLPEVWYALTRIAGHVGSLPIHLYKRDGERNANKDRTHPAWRLLHTRPNPMMGAAVFKETLQVHALLRGNGRAWIDRNRAGDPIGMSILPVSTKTVLVNGVKYHVANVLNAKNELVEVVIHDRDCLHIIGLSFDGLVGLDLVEYASPSWGTGLAALKTSQKAFENYGVPGLLLSAPNGTFKSEKEATDFLERFRSMQEGPNNAGKTALLRAGITATVMSQTVADMQLLESRKSSRQDAALWFILESIVGDDTSVSYNSLEQKMLAYLSNCLLRWLVRWEQECDEKLLSNKQKNNDTHYHRFATGALLRTDMKSQAEYLSKLVAARIMNPNESRGLLEMNEYEGGDEFANPAITVGQPGATPDPAQDPKQAA